VGARLWFHAASLGDQAAIQPLVERAQEAGYLIARSAVTRSGRARARELSPQALQLRAPLLWGARPQMVEHRPALIILELLELWPHWLRAAESLGVPVAVVNGRIGQGTLRAAPVLRSSFRRLGLFAAQTERDAARARSLGVAPERIKVCGSSKYDRASSRGAGQFGPRPVKLCLGALRPEDEPALLAAAPLLRGLKVLIAPRYLERVPRLMRGLKRAGLSPQLRSQSQASPLGEWLERSDGELLVLDSYGELSAAYERCEVAIIGGTFGGRVTQARPQSMIEAARAGCVLIVGERAALLPLELEALSGDERSLLITKRLSEALSAAHEAAPLTPKQWSCRARGLEGLRGASARQWELLMGLLEPG